MGQGQKVVCGLSHGRNHDNDVIAVLFRIGHMVGNGLDAVRVCHRCATVLLNN